MLASSKIGQLSARINMGAGDTLVALRAYLDSSGKLEGERITLAAVASTDEIWGQLETEWKNILSNTSLKAQYVHMSEIYGLKKGFDKGLGWTHKIAFEELVMPCVQLMSAMDKKKFRVFYCQVDLVAWRKLRSLTYQMPTPVELCNTFCSENVIGWYLLHVPEIINPCQDSLRYFFDKDEYFLEPFSKKWKQELAIAEEVGSGNIWEIIEQVSPAIMKKTPGIQAADIVAWAVNRESFAREGELAKYLAHIVRTVIPSYYIVWNEEKLIKQYKPLLYT